MLCTVLTVYLNPTWYQLMQPSQPPDPSSYFTQSWKARRNSLFSVGRFSILVISPKSSPYRERVLSKVLGPVSSKLQDYKLNFFPKPGSEFKILVELLAIKISLYVN